MFLDSFMICTYLMMDYSLARVGWAVGLGLVNPGRTDLPGELEDDLSALVI